MQAYPTTGVRTVGSLHRWRDPIEQKGFGGQQLLAGSPGARLGELASAHTRGRRGYVDDDRRYRVLRQEGSYFRLVGGLTACTALAFTFSCPHALNKALSSRQSAGLNDRRGRPINDSAGGRDVLRQRGVKYEKR
jgi:hypothetical protein